MVDSQMEEKPTRHKAVGIVITKGDGPCWVNENGDSITVDFDNQPPWSLIKEEGAKVFMPRFYFKTQPNPPTIWVSHRNLRGFRLHPAFKYPWTRHGAWVWKDPRDSAPAVSISDLPRDFLTANHFVNRAIAYLFTVEAVPQKVKGEK